MTCSHEGKGNHMTKSGTKLQNKRNQILTGLHKHRHGYQLISLTGYETQHETMKMNQQERLQTDYKIAQGQEVI